MTDRYAAADLVAFAHALFAGAGMADDRARVVAELLVEADLMGHDTHGLNLAANYLRQIEKGALTVDGDPEVLADRGPCLTWDGRYLSGVWLTAAAVDEAMRRAGEFGLGAVSIRRSHHIACLAAFLPRAIDKGMMVQIFSSDPSARGVAPFGAVEQCFTPNPLAVGYPTAAGPVLIDISASITTLGMAGRLAGEGRRFPGKWLIDNQGNATDDPKVLQDDPPGALLPLGGLDAGHKGFGLALMVEALTSGLAGFGRRDGPTNHGASVFVLAVDPAAFGGSEAFLAETGFLAERCRAARTPEGKPPARMPGDGAMKRKQAALKDGVALYPGIMDALAPWGEKLGVAPPKPL